MTSGLHVGEGEIVPAAAADGRRVRASPSMRCGENPRPFLSFYPYPHSFSSRQVYTENRQPPMPSITPSPQVLALASHQPPAAASSSSASVGRPAPSSTARQSLTALLAASPLSKSPGQVRASRKYLPKHNVVKRAWWKLVSDGGKGVERRRAQRSEEAKQDERDKVALCGSWVKDGTRPTDLFLDVSPLSCPGSLWQGGCCQGGSRGACVAARERGGDVRSCSPDGPR